MRVVREQRLLIAFALGVVVLVVLPFVLDGFRTLQLAAVGAYFIAILGVGILVDAGGRISLGQGAFMALGAYATAILVAEHGLRDLWTIPVAAAVAGCVGLLAGVVVLRASGLSFALVTLGLAIVVPTLPRKFDHFAGGSTGIALHGTLGARSLYAETWAIGIALFAFVRWLLCSRPGRSLRAVRDNDLAAAVAGINRSTVRVATFAASAALGGVAGALFALDAGHVSPQLFPLRLSLYLLGAAIAGWFGSIWGALAGALLIEFLPDLAGRLPDVHADRAGPAETLLGVLVVALVLLRPLVLRVRGRA